MTVDSVVAATAQRVAGTPDGQAAGIDVRDLVERIAARVETGQFTARRHPIGFLHIDVSALGGAPPSVEYRLHLWHERVPRVDGLGAIHDHGWAMTSAVLIGALEDVNYEARTSADATDAFVRVAYTPRGNDFIPAGTYEVAQQRRRQVPAPLVYHLEPGRLHTTEILAIPTMTFVVADRRATGPYQPLVSVAADETPTHIGPRPVIAPGDAADMLRLAADGTMAG